MSGDEKLLITHTAWNAITSKYEKRTDKGIELKCLTIDRIDERTETIFLLVQKIVCECGHMTHGVLGCCTCKECTIPNNNPYNINLKIADDFFQQLEIKPDIGEDYESWLVISNQLVGFPFKGRISSKGEIDYT